jgi:hypothetical protein
VDVSGADDDLRMQVWSDAGQVIAQGNLIGTRVVADVDVGLHIGHRWMMHADEDELDALREPFQLPIEPILLIAFGYKRSVAIERDGVDGLANLSGIPAAILKRSTSVPASPRGRRETRGCRAREIR